MNILMLNWKDIKNPHVGGAEIIAFEFAKRLVSDGNSVTFFTRSFPFAKPMENIDGVTVIRRGNRLSVYLHAFLYYRSLKIKPDRVVDMVNTICWQTPLYVSKSKRIFYVNQLAKEVFFYELPPIISHLSYLIEKLEFLPYRDTRTLCYSQSTKHDLVTFGIPQKNIAVFPMGLDHSRYKPGKKSAYPLFIIVARLVSMKRVDLCIHAMQKVISVDPSAQLAIVGNGPQESFLRSLIHKLQLEQNVHIVDKNNFFFSKNEKDVKVTLMQRAWVNILPSIKEGWGMVVTESAACQTPSIVSNVTGLRDSVVDQKTGLILSENPSADELTEAMLSVIKDTKMREELSKNALIWSKQFSWEKSYEQFRSFITNV